MSSIDKHLESYLGPIAKGWVGVGAEGLQVCFFQNRPIHGVVTYATLGLSNHVLKMSDERTVRQELLLSVQVENDDLAKLLAHLADGLIRDHKALLRGDILNLGHPIAKGSNCRELYVAAPVVFSDELAVFDGSRPSTVFAWLIPVHPSEAAHARRLGWSAFEERLEYADPDLFDLARPPIF